MLPPTPPPPRAPRTPSPPLLGRGGELSAAAERIDRLIAGSGSAWTYVGDAGSGKSALLAAVASRAAEAGVTVVPVAGLEGEETIAWAGVAELCAPFVDHLPEVGAARGRALRAALAIEEAAGSVDALAVALGLLELLAEGAASLGTPVLVVVDDLPWLDAESRRALAFVARRLGDDPVAMVAAARDGGATVGEVLELDPLGDAEVAELLVQAGVRARPVREAIAEVAAGRPLLALRLAEGLSAAERSGARPIPMPLRVPAEVGELFRPAIEALAAPERRALVIVAADRSGEVDVVARAIEHEGGSLDDLLGAEASGLVVVDGNRVAFAHPLARSAAYHLADAPSRRRAHRALAAATGADAPGGVLHRAAATVGRDDEVGDALAALADAAGRQGAPVTAASRWIRAAAMATADEVRADRLVAAARAALDVGDVTWADELLRQAERADPRRAERIDARLVDVRRAIAAGRVDLARRVADAADRDHGELDPLGVAELLVEVARPMLVEDPMGVGEVIARAWHLAGADAGRLGRRAALLHACHAGVLHPGEEADRQVDRWPELLELEGPVLAGPFLADTVALYLGYTGRRSAALDLLDRVEDPIRASGAVGALIGVLGARSFLTYGTDLRTSVLAGREALALSEETGQPGLSSVALDTLAIAAANVGDAELTDQVCQRELRSGSVRGEVWARAALARLHLVEGQPELAVEQFARLRRRVGPDNRSFTQFESDEAEALVRVGRIADARALLPALERDAALRGGWSTAQHERILALLAADIDEANGHFERARDALADGSNRIAQGVVELTWGEWLRRAKRRAEARRHLAAAVEHVELVGATGLRRRAEAELAAAGGTVARDRPADEVLAPVELQVARLAVAGHTNRTIAAELFLSPRTVENHLGAVYRKLAVGGRPGLAARAAVDPVLRAGGGA